jgi:Winged helix-turn helix
MAVEFYFTPELHLRDGRVIRDLEDAISFWLHEMKHEGFRVIARKESKRVRLYSRPDNDLTCPIYCGSGAPGTLASRARSGSRRVARQKAPADSIMRVSGMRERIQIELSAADRAELKTIVANRNSPQKHVWRAKIVLLTTDGHGTAEIMRRTGKAKTVIWRWQERFSAEGVAVPRRSSTKSTLGEAEQVYIKEHRF